MDLVETCDAIRSMRIRGAGAIGVAAAHALAAHIEKMPSGSDEAAQRLLATRPTAVTLENAVQHVLDAWNTGHDAADAAAAAADWERRTQDARDSLVQHAWPRLKGRVLTHCHSSTVVEALVHAHNRGHELHVTCTETRPFRQGRITSTALASAGIDVTLVVDSAAHEALREGVDVVAVGADALTADGHLVNKIGTASIARHAAAFGVPLLSLATTAKCSHREAAQIVIEDRGPGEVWADAPEGIRIRNPVFDVTPPEHIEAFMTEHGALAPEDVRGTPPLGASHKPAP